MPSYNELSALFAEQDRAMTKIVECFGTDERGRRLLHLFVDAWLDGHQ